MRILLTPVTDTRETEIPAAIADYFLRLPPATQLLFPDHCFLASARLPDDLYLFPLAITTTPSIPLRKITSLDFCVSTNISVFLSGSSATMPLVSCSLEQTSDHLPLFSIAIPPH